MDFVQPKKIMSPFSGDYSTPKLKTREYTDRTIVEAYWYCPTTGQYITKGIVSETFKDGKKHDWWKTVRKRRSDAKKESVGTVVHHTLNEQGEVHFYDVQWQDGIEKNIPASELIPEKRQKHKH